MRTLHRGSDQADDALEMAPSCLVIPSNPALTRGHPQGGGGDPGRAKQTVRRANQIARLATGKDRHPVWVFARDQRVP